MESHYTQMEPRVEQYMIESAIEDYDALIANREYKPLRLSERDLIETFGPEGIEIAKENLKLNQEKKKELEASALKYLIQLYKKDWQISQKEFMAEIAKELFGRQIKECDKNIHRLERIIGASKRRTDGGITPEMITEAKDTPIEDYLDFNKAGFARCPFHGERTASLKLYRDKNRAHCFGACGKGYDVIDIVQHQNEVDFLGAVKIILGK